MKKRIVQDISIVFAGAAGLFSALELFIMSDIFGEKTDRLSYVSMGIAAAVFIIYYVIRGRLYKRPDTWITFGLFAYAFPVTWAYYGLSFSLFTPRFYYVWCVILFLFFAVRVLPKPDGIIRAFSFTYVSVACVSGVYILVRATMTLREAFPGSDLVLGCFRLGRLCGMGNANTMAFFCLTGILLSIYGCIRGKRAARIFYGVAIAVLWFLMGLNNCRTTNAALAVTVALFVFALTLRHLAKKGTRKAVKFVVAASAAGVAGLTVILLLMTPTPIYRAGVTVAARTTNDQQMLDNVDRVYERNVTDVDTLNDRTLVWKRSLELIFKNPRRALFGISVRSPESVNGVYEGRHDIIMPFAHTMLLEIFRRLGLIGLIVWISLLCIWGKNAVSKFFDAKQDAGVVYLMAAAAGALLTGITEMGPFVFSAAIAIPYLFFFGCGIAMRDVDNEEKDLT